MAEKTNRDHPDISQITDFLFISSLPKDENAEHIFSLGIRLIISMPPYRPPTVYRKEPFLFLHCPTLDSPMAPIPQFMLRRGVKTALPVINEHNHAVLVHCRAGMHRSVAMACCILVAKGHTAESAMQLVKEKREIADPYTPHIRKRIEIFANDWKKYNG